MKSLNDLDRLRHLLTKHRLPKEQTLFMQMDEYGDTMKFLKNLGSSGVNYVTLPHAEPELECAQIKYGGYTFNIICY